jgi:hypothetical protein
MADACAASAKNSGQLLRDKPDGATVPARPAVEKTPTNICPQILFSSHARKKILLKLHYSDAFFAPAVMIGGLHVIFFVEVTG